MNRPKGMPKAEWRRDYLPALIAAEELREAADHIEAAMQGMVNLRDPLTTGTTIGAIMAPAIPVQRITAAIYTAVSATEKLKRAIRSMLKPEAAEDIIRGAEEKVT